MILSRQGHPWLKILEMRMKMIKAKENTELRVLANKLSYG